MDISIGISIGGANCCVGLFHSEEFTSELIFNERGTCFMPSYVAYTSNGGVLIGQAALDQQLENPKNTFYDIKRFLGCYFDSPVLQERMKKWPFSLAQVNNRTRAVIEVQGERKLIEPEDIAALLIKRLRETAEAFVGKHVKKGVLCVPADTNDAGRQAMKDASLRAGLNVMRIINEPTATSIAYGLDKHSTPERKVLICDIGRSMCDVGVLLIEDGIFEIVATSAAEVAGAAFDKHLMEYFAKEHSIQLPLKDSKAMYRLCSVCEQAKIALSTATETTIRVQVDEKQISCTVTRSQFEHLIHDSLSVLIATVKGAVKDARWRGEEVQFVILTGGSSSIPCVQRSLLTLFPTATLCGAAGWPPREAVCHGAAIQSAILCGQNKPIHDCVLLDMTQASVGVTLVDGQEHILIPRGVCIPCRMRASFSTARDFQTWIQFGLFESTSQWDTKKPLALAEIEGLPSLPKGMLMIEVSASIDVDYNLEVTVQVCGIPDFLMTQVVYRGKAAM